MNVWLLAGRQKRKEKEKKHWRRLRRTHRWEDWGRWRLLESAVGQNWGGLSTHVCSRVQERKGKGIIRYHDSEWWCIGAAVEGRKDEPDQRRAASAGRGHNWLAGLSNDPARPGDG